MARADRKCARCGGSGRTMPLCYCGAHFGGSCRCESVVCEDCGGTGKQRRKPAKSKRRPSK